MTTHINSLTDENPLLFSVSIVGLPFVLICPYNNWLVSKAVNNLSSYI